MTSLVSLAPLSKHNILIRSNRIVDCGFQRDSGMRDAAHNLHISRYDDPCRHQRHRSAGTASKYHNSLRIFKRIREALWICPLQGLVWSSPFGRGAFFQVFFSFFPNPLKIGRGGSHPTFHGDDTGENMFSVSVSHTSANKLEVPFRSVTHKTRIKIAAPIKRQIWQLWFSPRAKGTIFSLTSLDKASVQTTVPPSRS